MLHAQGHFSFPSLLPDYCQLPAGPGAHSCRQGIPGCLFHGRFLPACFMCFMCCCSQQARIALSGTSQVRQCWLARARCKPCTRWESLNWLPGEVGTSPPMIHASSQAAPQHKAHTCMTQHSTCLSCWRLCMAACHRIMHGQGSNLVGAWSPPVQHNLLLCPC